MKHIRYAIALVLTAGALGVSFVGAAASEVQAAPSRGQGACIQCMRGCDQFTQPGANKQCQKQCNAGPCAGL